MWSVSWSEPERVVSVTYGDPLTPPDLQAAILKAMEVGVAHRCEDFLVDCSRLSSGVLLVDLQEVMERVQVHGRPPAHREAIIQPRTPVGVEELIFYAQKNQALGNPVRLFPDRTSALRWLKG